MQFDLHETLEGKWTITVSMGSAMEGPVGSFDSEYEAAKYMLSINRVCEPRETWFIKGPNTNMEILGMKIMPITDAIH